jgi:hypothetical protein
MHQRRVLIDGEVQYWPGPRQTVTSPIHTRNGVGLEPVTLGSYPQGSEEDAESRTGRGGQSL